MKQKIAELKEVEKDHFDLKICNEYQGKFERSQLRHIVQIIDEAINTGL